jgi:hypothetical protein
LYAIPCISPFTVNVIVISSPSKSCNSKNKIYRKLTQNPCLTYSLPVLTGVAELPPQPFLVLYCHFSAFFNCNLLRIHYWNCLYVCIKDPSNVLECDI